MKIQTKILLLLSIVVALFLAGLLALNISKKRTLRFFRENLSKQTEIYFDKINALKGESLEILTYDYTYWDEMVRFVEVRDLKWAALNIDAGISLYKVNAAWIYKPDFSLVYSFADHAGLEKYGLKSDVLASVVKTKWFNHFYEKTPHGILEIRTAPIQPTADQNRSSTPRGYFVTGKLWTADFVKSLSDITESGINVISPEAAIVHRNTADSDMYLAHFERDLNGWDGKPIAALCVIKRLEVLAKLESFASRETIFIIAFALLIFLLLYSYLTRWVNMPLKALMRTLETKDMSGLKALEKREFEIKKIAELIRESEKLQTQLTQSSKLASMGTMAGGVAHELNNPLTGILGFTQLLLKNLPEGSQMKQDAARIEELTVRCRDIVQTLLSFARQENVQLSLININSVVHRTMEMIGEHLKTAGIVVEQRLTDPIPKVNANTIQLQQVFMNIINNAEYAMKNKGNLIIETYFEESLVVVKIRDTGRGIEKEQLNKIFDPFFTTKPTGQGTGLGLSLSHGIITALGGTIEAESTVGVGTAFIIKLPAVRV
jgi:signal transduction histidine kinase